MKMSESKKLEWSLFLKDGKMAYNRICEHCTHSCKQSYKVQIVACPSYKDKRSKD